MTESKKTTMSVKGAYAIYENEIFQRKYAVWSYEAREYCISEATKRLKELDPNSTQKIPLWLGQTPGNDGYYMVYGNPGPDDTLIYISKYRTVSGWFGGKYPELNKLYSIRYETMERVDIGKKTVSPLRTPEIVKSATIPDKVRDLSDPRDNLLFQIESGVKLKSKDERKRQT